MQIILHKTTTKNANKCVMVRNLLILLFTLALNKISKDIFS